MARSQPPQKSKPSSTPRPKPTPNAKPKGGKPAAPAPAASTSSSSAPAPSTKAKPTADSLRQEILDLGGDDEDYAMLQDVDEGDGEVLGGADDAVVDAKLSKELASFMKGLDFSKPFDDEEDEDEGSEEGSSGGEDDEEEAQDDDDESDEGEMPIDTPKKVKKVPEVPVPVAKKEEKKVTVVAPAPALSGANAIGAAPSAASGSLVKGKNGILIFPPLPQWYHHTLPALPQLPSLPALTPALLLSLTTRSSTLLTTLPTAPSTHLSSKADANFLAQILKSGTQADKLSALILLVQGDPLRNISALEGLRAMMGWREGGNVGRMGGREERVGVVRAVADWWNGGGAPNRKLRYLRDQPFLTHPGATDAHLLIWAFEDWLKKYFYSLLQILETLSHDTLPFVRTQTLTIVYQLLKDKPEQEQNLLRLLVNKLGDSDKTVASRASYHILQLLQSHPAMKSVVVREISSLVLVPPPPKAVAPSKQKKKQQKKKGKAQPMTKKTTVFDKAADDNGNVHARYYGIITLNQTTLTQRDGDVAGKLVEVYFEVFKGILGDGKYAKEEEAEKVEVVEPEPAEGSGGKDKHKGKGAWKGKGKKSDVKEDEVEDSDAKMIAAVLSGVNRALPFAKIEDSTFEKHMDTLFRITHSGTFNISIQALNLIHQVTSAKETVSERFFRTLYESLLDPRLASSSKQAMYLNLLFKAIKSDPSSARRAAFVKRTMQVLGTHQPPFICGAFFLLGELFSSTPGLRRMLSQPEEDDELEHFVDAPDPDEEVSGEKKEKSAVEAPVVPVSTEKVWDTTYDGRKRDPQYAHAEGSCLWEIVPFLSHFHPSVSLHASQLLNNEPITTSSDLNLNTLIHFLDRFVYRNAKKQKAKGASIMQPAAASDKSGVVLMMKGATNGVDAEVNTAEFWRKKEEDVPVDQLFFHKFFSQKLSKEKAKANKVAKRKGGNDSDNDDAAAMEEGEDAASDEEDLPRTASEKKGKKVASDGGLEVTKGVPEQVEEEEDSEDEFEKEVWKAMQKSMPELEDDGELMIGDSDGEDQSDDEEDLEDLSELGSDEAGSLGDDDSEDNEDDGSDGQIDDAEFDSADEEVFELDEDEDDLIEVDEDAPFVSAFPPEEGEDEGADEVEELPADGKRKRTNAEDRRERKKKRKQFSGAFGTYEDFQKLIEDGGPDDNI